MRRKIVLAFCATLTLVLVPAFVINVPDASATINYKGPTPPTIVPGKPTPFTFEIKNTTAEATAVRVRVGLSKNSVLVEDDSLKIVKFSAPNVIVEDGGWIWWDRVQIQPGKSFVVTLTLLAKKGTPVGTKFGIYVETVSYDPPFISLGDTDLPSITVVTQETVTTKAKSSEISTYFRAIYGRLPNEAEKKYWVGRIKNKPTVDALKGAMAFQKAKGKSPKVLTASSRVNISGGGESLTSGTTQRITVSYQAYPYGGTARGTLRTDIGSPDVSNVSPEPSSQTRDEGQGKIFLNWDYTLAAAETMSIAFDVKVPKKGLYGRDSMTVSAYAAEGYNNRTWSITEPVVTPTPTPTATSTKSTTPGLTSSQVTSLFKTVYGRDPVSQELAYWHKRAIEKRTAAALKGAMAFQKAQGKSPKDTTKSSPTSTPAIKITEKDFRILTPDDLSTDRADQTITWYGSSALQKKYPAVKIELCPGKDFKGCVILDAVVENDGSHIINMPPVPRIGKWYMHIIGRDSNNGLAPNVSAARLVTLHQ